MTQVDIVPRVGTVEPVHNGHPLAIAKSLAVIGRWLCIILKRCIMYGVLSLGD